MKKVDLLDRKILRVISVDARRSFKEIAEQCGVSRAAIHQRVVRMFDRGTITGSGYQINPKYLGFGTCSYIGIRLEKGSMYNAVVQELKKHIPNYEKTEAFFNKTHIYRELKEKGDMVKAIELSRELDKLHATEPEVYKSYTQMYKLFDIIREITK